jgi:serine/threonine protein kinase
MRRVLALAARVLAALVLAATLAACSSGPHLGLPAWQLVVDGAPVAQVSLPTHLNRLVPARRSRYALRTRVELPAELRGRRLRLVVPEIAAVVAARVDGEPATDLAWSTADGYRRRGPLEWEVPRAASADGVLELELEVEHTWTQSAWWGTRPRLLPLEDHDGNALAVEAFNLFIIFAALVALSQIGLTSLTVYVVDRRRKQYLWFSLQGLLACYLPFFVLGWSQRLFGVYDVPLLAITLVVATAASIQFTHIFFGLPPPWRGLWPTAIVVCAIAATMNGPFTATGIVGLPTVIFLTVALNYQAFACTRLVLRGVGGASARYSLASWLTLLVTCAPDLFYWLGLGDPLHGVRLASVGLAASGLLLSLRLSQEHITSLGRSDTLNYELAARVELLENRRAEIEQLNTELRRQIEDRAAQIYAALALAAGHAAGGRATAPTLAVGELVQGRYRVVQQLGAGGMGTVYEVERVADGRRLALKMAREADGGTIARLAREAQMASTVAHPNVVGILDVDVASSGFLYLVMELVEGGQSLHELRGRFGDPTWALPVLRQIADGLVALHAAGVVHRDLKPGNVLLMPGDASVPLVKISDFGIAIGDTARFDKLDPDDMPSGIAGEATGRSVPALDSSDLTAALAARPIEPRDVTVKDSLRGRAPSPGVAESSPGAGGGSLGGASLGGSSFLTGTGMLPGTPSYIAPELVHGREQLSPAADLFAFGVIAYEMIADRRPFAEAPVLALVERRPVATPRSILEAWPECPPVLAAALDACLSFDPRARPTAKELAEKLADPLAPRGSGRKGGSGGGSGGGSDTSHARPPQHIETI